MGGDHAPEEIVKGAIEVLPLVDAEIVLYGKESEIRPFLGDHKIRIVECSEIITGEDSPVNAIRQKKDSSMVRGMLDLKSGAIDGFVSAGNTGALLAGGLLRVGRIRGIERPALASVYPMPDKIGLITDAGANADCKPQHLVDFSIMSSLYASKVLGITNPSVGLVNIGSEEGKGNELTKETHQLLKTAPINYAGSIEGRDIPQGKVDVVICDGFTGNVILKVTEGVAMTLGSMVKDLFKASIMTKLSSLFFKKGFKKFKAHLDYTEYGGAPFLGVNGHLVKAHGSSNAKAVRNATLYLQKYCNSGVIEDIKSSLKEQENA